MRFILTIALFLQGWLFAAQTDFDIAVVGTSPTSMLEAIYHIYRNERVLILEADDRCGGAWKSVDICGVAHADLGCHLIGSDQRLKEFFENYFGCRFICLEHSSEEAVGTHARCPNGYYFSGGCHELITKLKRAIDARGNGVILNQRLESIYIDQAHGYVELSLGNVRYKTSKLIITPVSSFRVENPNFSNQEYPKHHYNHLYMLVEDPTPSRFTYLNGIAPGMSRAMNLTPFLEMPRDGLQLIVVQTHGKCDAHEMHKFLEAFKGKGLLTPQAQIVASDSFVYYQTYMNTSNVVQIGGPLVEMLDTSSFAGMVRYIEKWKAAIPLLKDRADGRAFASIR
ncbi:MAG: NAD(P)/FAD-dependent oxidoreductase [Verrucomicrobia bacterium]|nr:NAD(P)/FAD-dependent oxidoreductase [Verrucomicrobiota bacterium]